MHELGRAGPNQSEFNISNPHFHPTLAFELALIDVRFHMILFRSTVVRSGTHDLAKNCNGNPAGVNLAKRPGPGRLGK